MLLLLHTGQWFSAPPLHPLLVNFTAALLPASWIFELLGAGMNKDSLRSAAWWTLLMAAVVTPFTALAGWVWFRSMPDVDSSQMMVHKWLGTSAAVLVIPLAIWRGRRFLRGAATGAPYLVVLSLLIAALLIQGHLGATMSFGSSARGESQRGVPTTQTSRVTSSSQPTTSESYQWKDHIDMP